MAFNSLLNVFAQWVRDQPTKRLFTFCNDDGEVIHTLTYQQLDCTTSALCNHMLANRLVAGDRVLLVFFPSLDFMIAFLACLKAGLVAVPVFPPDPRKLRRDLYMFISITGSSGARFALTHSSYNFAKKVADIRGMFSRSDASESWPELEWIVIDSIVSNASDSCVCNVQSNPTPNTLAFLQYTSGSTSEPKGVMISHGNLSHNLSIIVSSLRASTSTIVCSWLPQYHDMGLIGSYLGVIWCGGSGVYISPLSFIKNPVLWVELISKFKSTHLQAPNFAYKLTAKKFNALSKPIDLDLSSVEHMINAAEPIDVISITSFLTTFDKFGLRQVMFPTYGLAEHTVFVCSNGSLVISIDRDEFEIKRCILLSSSSSSSSSLDMIGCGRPDDNGVHAVIVDVDSGYSCDEGFVGEIYLNSNSKALGYFHNDEITNRDFYAKINDIDDELFLRTGDLGFFYHHELFVCGRIKDLIIIGGRNYYPQDIERSIERGFDVVRPGCLACFSVSSSSSSSKERIVLVCELRLYDGKQDELASLSSSIVSLVSSEHGISLSSLILIPPRSIIKTSSGKISRNWSRKAYLNKDLKILHQWDRLNDDDDGVNDAGLGVISRDADEVRNMALSEIESELMIIFKASSSSTSLMELGLDSMSIAQFKGQIESMYHVDLVNEYWFSSHCTIHHLSQVIKDGRLNEEEMKLIMSQVEDEDGDNVVNVNKQPVCPWFVCCMK